jgi:hypothetical protein
MPVMIKSNQATELCITKGQEAIVAGWDASVGPSGKRVLDTLFVQLVKPPRPVQIPDLPLNVVPLSRTSTHITALLHDDSLLSINREQVIVLLNFAMTDYAAQGKSRNPNVVRLNNCKDHRAYYVALSRGHEAADTVIVQGFDEKKITSGMSGYLRQEFRELELLDEITRLRYENSLPRSVTGVYRGQLLASYRIWKGNTAQDPAHFHKAIQFDPKRDNKDSVIQYGQWKPTLPKNKTTANSPKKRKADKEMSKVPSKKAHLSSEYPQGNIQRPGPTGLIWDSLNHSCGYDALFTPLGEIWRDEPALWTQKLTECSPWLGLWALSMVQSNSVPETARDAVRQLLHFQDPGSFPIGPVPIILDKLLTAMTDRRSYGSAVTSCDRCNYRRDGTVETLSQYIDISAPTWMTEMYPTGMTTKQWFEHQFDRQKAPCPNCNRANENHRMRRRTTITELPTFMIIGINIRNLLMDEKLTFKTTENQKALRLRGLIYHAATERHFTSIVLEKTGTMWYHDGITTGRSCTRMMNIKEVPDLRALHWINEKQLCAAIYAEDV